MEHEQFVNDIEENLEGYAKQRLTDCNRKIMEIVKGLYRPDTEEDLECLITETNDWVNYFAKDQEELYEEYSYKLFKGRTGYYIAQGEEVYDVHIRYK